MKQEEVDALKEKNKELDQTLEKKKEEVALMVCKMVTLIDMVFK